MDKNLIKMMLSPPEILNSKKVLCIQPHPDDNEIGMGATIKLLSDRGCEIHYLTITDGRLGTKDPGLNPEELVKIRKLELKKAGKILGCSKFFNFNYPDGSLYDIPELAKKIAILIRENRYDAIFTPDPYNSYEGHNDHIVTGKATCQAFISSNLSKYPENTTTAPWQASAICFYFTSKPNTLIDIENNFEFKFKAIAEHKSQMDAETLDLFRIYFENKSHELGKKLNCNQAEDFKVLGPLHLHCFPEADTI